MVKKVCERSRSGAWRKRSATVPTWTFLSNHVHVLLLIARDPEVTLREVADSIGITERAVQRIVTDLEAAQYLGVRTDGTAQPDRGYPELPMRHPVVAHRDVGALIELITPP